MLSLGNRDDWSIGDQREVDAGIWDQVSLELSQVDIERAIEAERSRDRRDDCTKLVLTDSAISILAIP